MRSMRRPGRTKPPEGRAFGLTVAIALGVVGVLPLVSGATVRWWGLGIAALLVVLALSWPRALVWPGRAWAMFARLLHAITGPVMLTVAWALVMVPAGVVARLARRRPLALRLLPDAPSYWVMRQPDARGADALRDPY
jgi:hypothetical protein